MTPARHGSLVRSSAVSAIATGLSRVMGALRDVALSHVFGAGRASDVFWTAWTVPGIFRRFVADEGLSGALLPAVAQAQKTQGEQEAHRLAGAALTALLLACLAICAGGILAAPWLVSVVGAGFIRDPAKFELTVTLTRWLLPFVVLVSLVSYCESLLNLRGHFFIPKLAPGVVSGCIAAFALLLANRFEEPVVALAAGALVGGLAHLLVCLPPLVRRWGVPFPSLHGFRTPRFRRFLGEMGKVVVIGLAAQANVIVLRALSTWLVEGSVTQYWYANRIVDLAQGAVAVGVGSALLPAIARDAAEESWERFREHFVQAVRLVALVLLPVAGLLLVLAKPIVSVLFLHGAFDVAAADHTAATLRMLVPFMLALSGVNIVKKAFFALDARTPLLVVGALGVVATATFGYPLSQCLGIQGLGLALSISVGLQLVLYLAILRRRMHTRLGLRALGPPLLLLLLASGPAVLAAAAIAMLGRWDDSSEYLINWTVLAAAGAAAAALYVGIVWAFGAARGFRS